MNIGQFALEPYFNDCMIILFWVIISFLGIGILIALFVTVFHPLFKKNKNEKYILLESGPMINYSK